jgi:hypothetical protein
MFVLCGIGALLVWFLRRSLPESPRHSAAIEFEPRPPSP